MNDLASLAQKVYQIAQEAGESIMLYYRQHDPIVPAFKSDASPLTIADQASHEILVKNLTPLSFKDKRFGILSEEGDAVPFVERQQWDYYWCVDPLDGTKDFLKHNDEFTVNIALIHNHHPVLGVIYAPALQKGYLAWQGGGAYRYALNQSPQKLDTQRPMIAPLRVAVSRYNSIENIQPWLSAWGETELIHQGSALKFCTLAEGGADVFLRLSPSSEWDNAAGQCILQEAGGSIYTFDGKSLVFNRCGSLEQRPFIAVADSTFHWQKALIR